MLNFHEKMKHLLNVDPLIMGLYSVLSIFGLVMIYSASSYYALANQGNSEAFMVKQFVFIIIGIFMALGISVLPEKILEGTKSDDGSRRSNLHPASDCIIYNRCKWGEELD